MLSICLAKRHLLVILPLPKITGIPSALLWLPLLTRSSSASTQKCNHTLLDIAQDKEGATNSIKSRVIFHFHLYFFSFFVLLIFLGMSASSPP